MKLTRPRKIAIVIVLAGSIAPAAFAILGLGDIVFDPTNFGKLVEQLAQMQQQYTQLVQTYQVVTAQYNQMIWMAKMIPANLRVRYRTLVTPWRNSTATNTYPEPREDGSRAINTGNDVAGGYQRANPAAFSTHTVRLSETSLPTSLIVSKPAMQRWN